MKRSGLKRTGPPKRRTPLAPGKGLARTGQPARRTRLAPVSKKTAARNRVYAAARAEYQAANPYCEWVHPDTGEACGSPEIECHHIESRGVAPDLVTDPGNFASLCPPHHRLVTDDPKLGRRAGLVVRSSFEIRKQEEQP